MKDLTNKELLYWIYHTDEELHGDSLFMLLEEAEKRNLVVTFHNGSIVITEEEYGV